MSDYEVNSPIGQWDLTDDELDTLRTLEEYFMLRYEQLRWRVARRSN